MLAILFVYSSLSLGYEPPQALSPPAVPPPAPSPPAWQARALGTARLQLVEFSAFVEPPDAVDSVSAILGSSLQVFWNVEGYRKRKYKAVVLKL